MMMASRGRRSRSTRRGRRRRRITKRKKRGGGGGQVVEVKRHWDGVGGRGGEEGRRKHDGKREIS